EQRPPGQLRDHLPGGLPLSPAQLLCRQQDVIRNIKRGSHASDASTSTHFRQRSEEITLATRIHLDTDLGGDPDDLCRLSLLLGWPEGELVGVTTSTKGGALRAGMIDYALRLAGRVGIPVAAGADGSLGGYRTVPGFPDQQRHWPDGVTPRPASPGAA